MWYSGSGWRCFKRRKKAAGYPPQVFSSSRPILLFGIAAQHRVRRFDPPKVSAQAYIFDRALMHTAGFLLVPWAGLLRPPDVSRANEVNIHVRADTLLKRFFHIEPSQAVLILQAAVYPPRKVNATLPPLAPENQTQRFLTQIAPLSPLLRPPTVSVRWQISSERISPAGTRARPQGRLQARSTQTSAP